jgi:hypothetical protein
VLGKRRSKKVIFPPFDTVQRSFDARKLNPLAFWVQYGPASVDPIRGCEAPVPYSVVFNFPFVSDDAWRVFAEDAFNSFSTQIPTDISIANFAWELRELGSLIPKISDSLKQTYTDLFLNLSFGWKPFLKDLRTLGGLLNRVNSRIDFLKSTYGKKTRLGMYRANAVQDVPFNMYTQDLQDMRFSYVKHRWELVGHRVDLRAGGYLFHQLQDLDSTYSFIRAMLVSLGLDNPLKAFWNAIPYSFVADWFTGLSRELGKLSINPFEGNWSVSEFSSSANAFARWKVTQVIDGGTYPDNLLGYVDARRYERISYLPIPESIINLQVPSPQQLLLLNAMLAQQ